MTMINNWNREKYIQAWDFATLKHSGQYYNAPVENVKIDYISHIGAVTMELMWFLKNTNSVYDADLMLLSGVLHDTLEDTQTSFSEIENLFGKAVAEGVLALSKNENLPRNEQMADSLERILLQPKEIWIVKMADRVINLREPAFHWKNEKIISYLTEGKLIYEKLHTADELMAQRLMEKILEYPIFLEKL